ncbi:MAG: hypothetical protein DPW09_34290 [Anaerolineae bacterium]|nr:DUF559 domain-containing protein [Anaerolineales bacterium]MCQ3978522.1 hypothetical protein [Anaerolineae bacterium]
MRKQVWIDKYRVDFYLSDKRVIIELDGHDGHKSKEDRTRDAKRERYLERKGYRVIRFTGSEIYKNARQCVQEVVDFLNSMDNIPKEKESKFPQIRYCVRMQEVITHIAEKHNLDLDADEAYLTLEQEHFDRLSIQKSSSCLVSISHYFIQNDDICYNPRLEFFIQYDPGADGYEWIPISITQFTELYLGRDYHRNCARIEDEHIIITDWDLHKDIAQYAEGWARHIRQNEWIERGRRVNF